MKRAAACFMKEGFKLKSMEKVAPRCEQGSTNFTDFLPSMRALSNSTLALHEYGGLFFYTLVKRL